VHSTLIGNVRKKIDKNRYGYKLNRLVVDVQRTLIGKEEKLKIYQLHVKKINTVNTGQSGKPWQGYHPAEHCKTKKLSH